MLENILNKVDLCLFLKDQYSRFVYCNEAYAERAGLDSPAGVIGKSDFDFSWRKNAEFYQQGDRLVLQGEKWSNIVEPQIIGGNVYDVLVTKSLLTENNRLYIFGFFHDVTGLQIMKKNGYFDPIKKRFYLGAMFNHQYLTIQEYKVFRYVVSGYTAKRIAELLKLSPKTVESYIENIKLKLNCETKNDIVTTAISHGFTFILAEPLC